MLPFVPPLIGKTLLGSATLSWACCQAVATNKQSTILGFFLPDVIVKIFRSCRQMFWPFWGKKNFLFLFWIFQKFVSKNRFCSQDEKISSFGFLFAYRRESEGFEPAMLLSKQFVCSRWTCWSKMVWSQHNLKKFIKCNKMQSSSLLAVLPFQKSLISPV